MKKILIAVAVLFVIIIFCFIRYREFYQLSNIDNRYYFIDCWKFKIKIPYLKPRIDESKSNTWNGTEWVLNEEIQKSIPLDNNREVVGI